MCLWVSSRAIKGLSGRMRNCEFSPLSKRVSLFSCSLAILDISGFVTEGRKRKANWADGGWEDVLDMAILEEEWMARSTTAPSIPNINPP